MHMNGWLRSGTLFSLLWSGIPSIALAQNAWQLPQKSWLYVLDADASADEGHVLLVDPDTAAVKGTITVGMEPDLTASPDGSRIFVVSGSSAQGKVVMYDARTGHAVASTDIQQRILYTTWPQSSTIAVSRDGRWLFVETMQPMAPGIDRYDVLRFELARNSIREAGRAALPECGIAQLAPESDGDWDLLVHCPLSNIVRRILFDIDGHVSKYADLELPSRPFDPAYGQREHGLLRTQAIVYSGAGDDVLALTGSNELCRLNFQHKSGPCSSFPTELQGRWIPRRPWSYSTDGRFMYFGSGEVADRSQGTASSIEIADTVTMTIVARIEVSTPFRTLAVDSRGEKLYAAGPQAHKIMQIDLKTKREIKEIALPGFSPAIVVPAT